MTKRILALIMALAMVTALHATAWADEEEDALRQTLTGLTGQDTIALFDCADSDGDGAKEAFALIGSQSGDGGYEGALWFVGPRICCTVPAEGETRFQSMRGVGNGAPRLFIARVSEERALMYCVAGGMPRAVAQADLVDLNPGSTQNEFYAPIVENDLREDGVGQTVKNYAFFLDLSGAQPALREYGGIAIGEEQLLRFAGAADILTSQIPGSSRITGILYRLNGLIHINMTDGVVNRFLTLRCDGPSVTLAESGGGTYLPACRPEIAVYPEEADLTRPTATPEPTYVPEPTAEPTPTPTPDPGYVEGVTLSEGPIRTGPGLRYDAVAVLPAGTTVRWMGESAEDERPVTWYHVTSGLGEGWISQNLVDLSGAAPDTDTGSDVIVVEIPTAAPEGPASISAFTGAYTASESSYRRSNQGIVVDGSRAADGNLSTAWNSLNSVAGAWVQIDTANAQRYMVQGVRIAPGYWKNSNVFWNNAAPADIEVYCDGALTASATLTHEKNCQTVWFASPVACSSVRIVVRSAYFGRGFNARHDDNADVCVTELELLGPQGRTLRSDALGDWGRSVQNAATNGLYGSARLSQGSSGMDVLGLQVLLRDGFGVLSGTVDGAFGQGTATAVDLLASRMRSALPSCEAMQPGVVDAAYWRNMMAYMDSLNG